VSPNTQYKTEISIGYGQLKLLIEGCEKKGEHDWGVNWLATEGSDGGLYDFYFETEEDYINFILWKK